MGGGGDGITLHKITKCADIKRKIKPPHGSEFTLMLDPNPYPDPDLMNPDPQHFWAAEFCSYSVSGRR